MRAIIFVINPTTYVEFVMKYFMPPQNIGENKTGVKNQLFFPITVKFTRQMTFDQIFSVGRDFVHLLLHMFVSHVQCQT